MIPSDLYTEDRCKWINHQGKRVHIPGCMGAANGGPDMCNCLPMPKTPQQEVQECLRLIRQLKSQAECLAERLEQLGATKAKRKAKEVANG